MTTTSRQSLSANTSIVLLAVLLLTILLVLNNNYVKATTCYGVSSTSALTCSGHGDCASYNYCSCTGSYPFQNYPYSGVNCEVDVCYQNAFYTTNCNRNGQCIRGVCKCNEGTSGFNCHLNSTYLSCYGYPSTDSRVCSGHGKCYDSNVCACNEGYIGLQCETHLCFGVPYFLNSSVCSGRGTCKSKNTCECQKGFSGSNCQEIVSGTSQQSVNITIPSSYCGSIIDSDSRACNGRGRCIGNETCVCNDGYDDRTQCKNTFCYSIPQYESSVCSGHGSCLEFNTCNCSLSNSTLQFIGNECEIVQCLGKNMEFYNSTDLENVCNGHGQCSSQYGGCKCNVGYFGAACEEFSCFGISSASDISCSGNGQCIGIDLCSCFSSNEKGFWEGTNCDICEEGYSGEYCNQTNICLSEASCNNLGTCSNSICQCDGSFTGLSCSVCDDGSYGPLCNQTCSRLDTCHDHGDCGRDGVFCECDQSIVAGFWDDSSMCSKCQSGYYGSSCLLKLSKTFTLNQKGNEIVIPLLMWPKDLKKSLNCSLVLHSETLKKLGTDPLCWVDSNMILRITIPKDASFSPVLNSDRVVIIPNGLEYSNEFNDFNLTLSYDAVNTKLLNPVAKIHSSSVFILPNQDLILLGSNLLSIERERNLTFEWSIKSSDSAQTTFQTNIISQMTNGKSGQLSILYSDIPSTVSTFQIQLIVKNQICNITSDPTVLSFTLLKLETPPQTFYATYDLVFDLPSDILYVHNDMIPYQLKYSLVYGSSSISLPNPSYSVQFSISPTPSDPTFIIMNNTMNGALVISSSKNMDPQYGTYEGFDNTLFNTSNVYQIKCTVNHIPSGKVIAEKTIKSFFFDRYTSPRPDLTITEDPQPTQGYPASVIIKTYGHVFESVEWDCIEWGGLYGRCSSEWMAAVAAAKGSTTLSIPLDTFLIAKNPLYVRAKGYIAGTPYYLQYPITPSQGFGFKTFNGVQLSTGSSLIYAGVQIAKIDRVNTHTAIYSWLTAVWQDTDNGATVTYEVTDQDGTILNPNYITLSTAQRKFTINGANIPLSVKSLKVAVKFTVPNFAAFKYRAYLYLIPGGITQSTPTSTLNYTTIDNGLRIYTLKYQLAKDYFAPQSTIYLKIGSTLSTLASICPWNTQIVKFVLPPLIDASSIVVDVTYDSRYIGGISNNPIITRYTLQNLPAESSSSNVFIRSLQDVIHTDANGFLNTNYMLTVMNNRYLGEEYDFTGL